jgi:ATP-binding cassette, subfamily B, bacterial
MLLACALAVKAAPGTLAGYVILTLAVGTLPVATAWLTKMVLDGLVSGAPLHTLVQQGAGLSAAGVVTGTVPHATQYLRAELDRQVGLLTQDRLFAAIDGFVGLGRFEDPHFLDRLRLAQQAGRMTPNQLVNGTLGIGQAVTTIAGFLGSLYLISALMAVLVLASGVPTLIAEIALSRRRVKMYWGLGPVERRESFYSSLLSSVEAAKETRLLGIGAFLRARMLADRRTSNAARRSVDRREAFVQSGLGLLAALVSGGGLMWAVSAARAGHLSIGDITVFVGAVAGVQGAVTMLTAQIASSHEALLMFDHFVAVTTAGPELPTAASPRALPPLHGEIELRDVWFRYSAEQPWILRGVNLRIPYGQTLTLVGLNGAGKSTLVKLLCRFYDPTRGAVLWDGVDLREIEPAELRQRIGAVFQDYMRYDMTAAENVGLGDLEAFEDTSRIQAAARRADIHGTLIGLPRGYDTLLSRMFFMESEKDAPEAGVVLSGGQWQRLALARAFLRDKRDLMILDEPSAGLDAEAEHEIHASLTQHRKGQTSLLISHRLGAVRDADAIVVLRDGVIVEQGNHASLMADDGDYARLFRLQASGYQTSAGGQQTFTTGQR